jgi:hypothetical protein
MTTTTDNTWRETVNGKARSFHPSLDAAIAHASLTGDWTDLTNAQAAEYVKRFPMTDNTGEPHELWRNIADCGCRELNGHVFSEFRPGEVCVCDTLFENAALAPCTVEHHFCFTTALDDDYSDDEETEQEFVDGWEIWYVVPNVRKMHCDFCGSDFLHKDAPQDSEGSLCPQCGRGEDIKVVG